jgi:hypothetical protein
MRRRRNPASRTDAMEFGHSARDGSGHATLPEVGRAGRSHLLVRPHRELVPGPPVVLDHLDRLLQSPSRKVDVIHSKSLSRGTCYHE